MTDFLVGAGSAPHEQVKPRRASSASPGRGLSPFQPRALARGVVVRDGIEATRPHLRLNGSGAAVYIAAMSSTNPLDLLRGGTVPLYLAPQAGVSESPFRRLCRSFGADVVVSEFVSAEGIRRHDKRTHTYLRFHDDERPIGIQIFGAEPDAMAEAARLVEEVYEPDFLDINFGCPVKKVVNRNGGSGCLRDLDLVQSIIRAVKGAIG